jgi:GTPase SAR1 family protein/signal transduction histidine kinase
MAASRQTDQRFELKLVFWGPARSGKTTVLRSLHAAADPRQRGELVAIEGDVRGVPGDSCFEYAPLDLPTLGGVSVRADCFAVPGSPSAAGVRRRLMRGAHGVLFVAEASKRAMHANLESWRTLNRLLHLEEESGDPIPVAVLVNKTDLPGAMDPSVLAQALLAGDDTRTAIIVSPGTAPEGTGLLPPFFELVHEALARSQADTPTDGRAEPAAWHAFDSGLVERFGSDTHGAPVDAMPALRTAPIPDESWSAGTRDHVSVTPPDPDQWLTAGDAEMGHVRQERAISRLLADIGQLCGVATDIESVVRGVLMQLVMNLDAVIGWVGLTDASEGEAIYDPMGRAHDAGAVADAAQALALGLPIGQCTPVGAAATSGFPGGGAGGEGLFLSIPVAGGTPGWLLLIGAPGRGLPPFVEPVLRTATTFLGLTAARLNGSHALRALRRATSEHHATDASQGSLRAENARLTLRLREREAAHEQARQAVIETERDLLDRERIEGVRELAAQIAHHLNNPLSAVCANLAFVLERRGALDEIDQHTRSPGSCPDELEALRDALEAAHTAAAYVRSLFQGDVHHGLRAALRTPLAAAIDEALAHYGRAYPGAALPVVSVDEATPVGVARAQLTRWLFRLMRLTLDGQQASSGLSLDTVATGVRLRLEIKGKGSTDMQTSMAALRDDVRQAGAGLEVFCSKDRIRCDLTLPPASGSRGGITLLEKSA